MSKTGSRTVTHKHSLRQVVTYLISGGAFFFSSYAWFFIADRGLHWNLFAAKVSSSLIGLLINFLLQHYWVFGTHKSTRHAGHFTGKYIVLTIVDLLIDYLIVSQLKKAGISPYIGQFVSSGFFVLWNYYWYKFWVFADDLPKAPRLASR